MNGITIGGNEYRFKAGVTIGYLDRVMDFETENDTVSVFISPAATPESREKRKSLWADYCALIFEGDYPPIEDCTLEQITREIPTGFFAAQVLEAKKQRS